MKVKDKYRTNELSLRPGGCTVVVEFVDGRILEYDKIKNPSAYIAAMVKKPEIKNAYVKSL